MSGKTGKINPFHWGDKCSLLVPNFKVVFDILSIKIISNIDYHLERLSPFKLLVILNVVFGIYKQSKWQFTLLCLIDQKDY